MIEKSINMSYTRVRRLKALDRRDTMALTAEDLQVLSTLLEKAVEKQIQPVKEHLNKLDERLNQVDERLNQVDKQLNQVNERLNQVDERLSAVEENTQITREAVNSLIEWADNVSVITQIKFPVPH